MGLHLHEGKAIEELLVGKVRHPANERDFKRVVDAQGIWVVRNKLYEVLSTLMSDVRKDQVERDPSNPKIVFAKNLLSDLDLAMGSLADLEGGKRYQLRLYSSCNSLLDFGTGFDCWVEVYDFKAKKPIADCKIDLTEDPAKTMAAGKADLVYYFNPFYLNEALPGKIDKKTFADREYQLLVRESARLLKERMKNRPIH